ncbi:hypothetical protein ACPCBX_13605 [Streptomyces tuirus]|uniref:Uncharacterized protein n=1 Tax=Streptomyces tuirus TaxID=68278 RepID=A0A7G1NAY5_9ACTN|nr:hypothetical protein [Streptomyces tuirus]BCL20293.1 hypothetical protein GCM10017668_21360 [Streptomyces tuirus]
MKRRPGPVVMPLHVSEMQPERYRDVAVSHLEDEPDDTFGAAMAVWRAYLAERRDWFRDHQVRRYVDGRDTLGTPRPPFAWVRLTFGTPEPRWPS